ncbi:MAG: hypothetical protein FRX49_05819 [Trebouxia sp. A1-2]|nr:MAG: hypothetical protein FRX49_05819 [Trebouxia sp. A1-2]
MSSHKYKWLAARIITFLSSQVLSRSAGSLLLSTTDREHEMIRIRPAPLAGNPCTTKRTVDTTDRRQTNDMLGPWVILGQPAPTWVSKAIKVSYVEVSGGCHDGVDGDYGSSDTTATPQQLQPDLKHIYLMYKSLDISIDASWVGLQACLLQRMPQTSEQPHAVVFLHHVLTLPCQFARPCCHKSRPQLGEGQIRSLPCPVTPGGRKKSQRRN